MQSKFCLPSNLSLICTVMPAQAGIRARWLIYPDFLNSQTKRNPLVKSITMAASREKSPDRTFYCRRE
jgi:hypothetical protein